MSRFFIVVCVGNGNGIEVNVTVGEAQSSVVAIGEAASRFVARYGYQPRTTVISHEYSVKELQEIILRMQEEARS